ncbi:MAG: hypothetical protein HQM10_20830 [Candidatus Riflebacteria bacterium]|nr:hypothetical protein [Candidatus Riflebacteria bacterium]
MSRGKALKKSSIKLWKKPTVKWAKSDSRIRSITDEDSLSEEESKIKRELNRFLLEKCLENKENIELNFFSQNLNPKKD